MPLKKTIKQTIETSESTPMPKTKAPAKPISSPKDGKKPKRLPFRRFFNAVREDPAVIKDALEYYDDAVEDGSKHIELRGNLETLMVETPGLAYFYRGIRTDAQQLRRWMEKILDNDKADKYKWFHSDPDSIKQFGKFKTATEINKYVDADEKIQDLVIVVRELAEAEHRLEDLMEGFEERRITLSRLIEIRKEGLKEVWIDQGAGDDNA